VFCQYHVEKNFCVLNPKPQQHNPRPQQHQRIFPHRVLVFRSSTTKVLEDHNDLRKPMPIVPEKTTADHLGKNHYRSHNKNTHKVFMSWTRTPPTQKHTHKKDNTNQQTTKATSRQQHQQVHNTKTTSSRCTTPKTMHKTTIPRHTMTTPTKTPIHQDEHNHRTLQVHLLFLEKPYMSSWDIVI